MKKKSAKRPRRAKPQPAAARKPAKKKPAKKRPAKKRTSKASDEQPAPASDSKPSILDNPPAWLSEEPAAHWPMVVEQIRQRDMAEMVTPQHVAIYCQTLSRYQAAMNGVETNGFTVSTERGEFVSPATHVALRLIEHLRHLAKDLGLNEPIVGYKDALKQLGFRLQAKQAAGTN